MSVDHSDEPGFPAPQTRVRSVPVELSGMPQFGRVAKNANPPTAELGWLTPIRKTKGDPCVWFWRCRCGNDKVLKRVQDVRSSVKRGRTPKCKTSCPGVAP